jgi:hypothetical protein
MQSALCVCPGSDSIHMSVLQMHNRHVTVTMHAWCHLILLLYVVMLHSVDIWCTTLIANNPHANIHSLSLFNMHGVALVCMFLCWASDLVLLRLQATHEVDREWS